MINSMLVSPTHGSTFRRGGLEFDEAYIVLAHEGGLSTLFILFLF